MITVKGISNQNFNGKKCLLRLDLNIPISENGQILDDTRIRESKPSIDYLLEQNTKVVIVSHMGRPKGKYSSELSFENLLGDFEKILKRKIVLVPFSDQEDALKIINSLDFGTLFLLDNIRFNKGEESSDSEFIKFLSSLADVFINDGFGTIHRNHSSITGIANVLPSFGGILLEKEIEKISQCIQEKAQNSTAILGGAKIQDKIPIIENLSKTFNKVIITGGMIRPFLMASEKIPNSKKINNDEINIAKKILIENEKIFVPDQLICSESIDGEPVLLNASQIKESDNIFDIGPNSMASITNMILSSDKIIWNGPPGVYEKSNFQNGTKKIIDSIVESNASYKVAGGGSTVAAINFFSATEFFTHISTGGGAFLSLLEGKFLQGIEVLKE